jgi:PRTRC genetic system ThiF family protein
MSGSGHTTTKTINKISVYGCGGTGSHVLNGLARINHALHVLNRTPIHVTAFDPDIVSYSNVGRQAFYESDVGHNKAKTLCQRINLYYRTNWMAVPRKAPSRDNVDLCISCVDTVKSREAIAKSWQNEGTYMIDCGNAQTSGQVLIGQYKGDLPNIYEEHSDLIYGDEPTEEESPGCVDQFFRQDLFVNSVVANHALHFVWSLLRWGKLEVQGVFFDLTKGVTNPIKINNDN